MEGESQVCSECVPLEEHCKVVELAQGLIVFANIVADRLEIDGERIPPLEEERCIEL